LVHGPSLPEQALRGHPSLARDTMSEAIALAAEVSVTTRREVRAGGGQTH
jgi:pyrrolidone-carboxylate peptidase